MILFFVLLLMVSLVVFLIGRGLSRVGQSDAHRVELLLSGEALTDHYRPLNICLPSQASPRLWFAISVLSAERFSDSIYRAW
jgi:hypothetical protein